MVEWMQEFSKVPDVSILDDRIRIADVRDFSWSEDGLVKRRWITRTISREDLKDAYLVTEQFRKWGAAHTFLCFTTDLDPICVSVEARRKKDQPYSIWRGLLGQYELIYLFGSANDLFGQRIDTKSRELDVAKLTLSDEDRWTLFANLAKAAEANARESGSYHSIKRNCATELAKAIPKEVRTPLLPKNLHPILMESGLAEVCDIYDAEDRPPFM